jgi:hypothetical protein
VTNIVDQVFPLAQSDTELGDVYEHRGFSGTYRLLKDRAAAEHALYDDSRLRCMVADMFGVGPGDLWP